MRHKVPLFTVIAVMALAIVVLVGPVSADAIIVDFGDSENESGDIESFNNFSIEGNNNNMCVGLLQFGQTGNFTNQQEAGQFFSAADDIEFEGQEVTFVPVNETACEQEIQQAAAASSWGDWSDWDWSSW